MKVAADIVRVGYSASQSIAEALGSINIVWGAKKEFVSAIPDESPLYAERHMTQAVMPRYAQDSSSSEELSKSEGKKWVRSHAREESGSGSGSGSDGSERSYRSYRTPISKAAKSSSESADIAAIIATPQVQQEIEILKNPNEYRLKQKLKAGAVFAVDVLFGQTTQTLIAVPAEVLLFLAAQDARKKEDKENVYVMYYPIFITLLTIFFAIIGQGLLTQKTRRLDEITDTEKRYDDLALQHFEISNSINKLTSKKRKALLNEAYQTHISNVEHFIKQSDIEDLKKDTSRNIGKAFGLATLYNLPDMLLPSIIFTLDKFIIKQDPNSIKLGVFVVGLALKYLSDASSIFKGDLKNADHLEIYKMAIMKNFGLKSEDDLPNLVHKMAEFKKVTDAVNNKTKKNILKPQLDAIGKEEPYVMDSHGFTYNSIGFIKDYFKILGRNFQYSASTKYENFVDRELHFKIEKILPLPAVASPDLRYNPKAHQMV